LKKKEIHEKEALQNLKKNNAGKKIIPILPSAPNIPPIIANI